MHGTRGLKVTWNMRIVVMEFNTKFFVVLLITVAWICTTIISIVGICVLQNLGFVALLGIPMVLAFMAMLVMPDVDDDD